MNAGMVSPDEAAANPRSLVSASNDVADNVSVRARGTYLVTIDTFAETPTLAQALGVAVTTEYQRRNDLEAQRRVELASSYFSEQLELAMAELDVRQQALDDFVALHPASTSAPGPDRTARSTSRSTTPYQRRTPW